MTTERIEAFYRDATAADVLRVMNGETMEARFQDQKNYCWFYSSLSGWKDGPFPWGDEAVCFWQFCQVYDPPQYWLEKPEPGEGYRLLGKFPDEDLQEGDEVFDLRGDRKWEPSCNVKTKHPQDPSSWYRRKIEQPKPEPKHYKLQVGDTAETPSGHQFHIVDQTNARKHYAPQVGDSFTTPSGHRIIVTDHGIEVQ